MMKCSFHLISLANCIAFAADKRQSLSTSTGERRRRSKWANDDPTILMYPQASQFEDIEAEVVD